LHLIQILLPLYDNTGTALAPELYGTVQEKLTKIFGGLTAFTRAPAEGLWRDQGKTKRDDVVVFEIMTDSLDEGWWRSYRGELERDFRQDVIVIRAQEVRLL
jgi:hypothetical protein